MADQKLTALTAVTSIATSDLIYVVQSTTSKKATISQVPLVVGAPVLSGTATRILFEGAGPVVADDVNFTYSATNFANTYNGMSILGDIPNIRLETTSSTDGHGPAIFFADPTHAEKWQFFMNAADLGFGALNRTGLNYAFYCNPSNQMIVGSTGFTAPSIVAQLDVITRVAAQPALMVQAASAQSTDIQQWRDSTPTVVGRINKAGYHVIKNTVAPADGDLSASEVALWLDATMGATKLMIKAKDSGGTVRTGTVALT